LFLELQFRLTQILEITNDSTFVPNCRSAFSKLAPRLDSGVAQGIVTNVIGTMYNLNDKMDLGTYENEAKAEQFSGLCDVITIQAAVPPIFRTVRFLPFDNIRLIGVQKPQVS